MLRCQFRPAIAPVPVSSMRRGLPWRRSTACRPACSKGLRGASSSCRDSSASVRDNGLLPLWSLNCVHFPYTFIFIVTCPFEESEFAVFQPFVFFCFRCKVKFAPRWVNGGRMGKVYKKKMRHTVVYERYSAWI